MYRADALAIAGGVSEDVLIGARQDALATAQQAATAQGSVGAIVNGLTEADYEIQAAVDVEAGVADLDANGLDAELKTALADMGLRSGQIDQLGGHRGVAWRHLAAQSGVGVAALPLQGLRASFEQAVDPKHRQCDHGQAYGAGRKPSQALLTASLLPHRPALPQKQQVFVHLLRGRIPLPRIRLARLQQDAV